MLLSGISPAKSRFSTEMHFEPEIGKIKRLLALSNMDKPYFSSPQDATKPLQRRIEAEITQEFLSPHGRGRR